jgi:MFS family permease
VSFSITVLLAARWGAGASSFYSVSAAHATDRTESGQIAQVMSGMLFVWAGGSVLGPILTGAVADTQAGQPGVFAAVAFGYFVLMAANLWRVVRRERPGVTKRSPFKWFGQTSVVQGKVVDEADLATQAQSEEPVAPPAKPAE